AGAGLGRSPDPGPTGSALAAASPSSSPMIPRATTTDRPPPTEMPGFGCVPVVPGGIPEFELAPSSGRSPARRGAVGPPDWAQGQDPTAAWPVPQAEAALILGPEMTLQVGSTADACIRYAIADYIPVERPAGAQPVALGELNVNPPGQLVELGSLPRGEWVLRVVVYYATGVAGGEDKAVIERFFRVTSRQVGPGETPNPCEVLDPAAASASLQVGETSVPGSSDGRVADVGGTFPDLVTLVLDRGMCATSVDFNWSDANGDPRGNWSQDVHPQTADVLRVDASQQLLSDGRLAATVHFVSGDTVTFTWHVRIATPPLPEVRVVAPDGDSVAFLPSCGMNFTRGPVNLGDACTSYGPPPNVERLTIRDGDVVRFAVPDTTWIVDYWGTNCGTLTSDGQFDQQINCSLGAGSDAASMAIVPLPGRYVVALGLAVEREQVQLSATLWVEIDAVP
ncbi:MAG: hypothetical protein ABIV26_01780, partial [Candidatus Limnocylindrales bacterium]